MEEANGSGARLLVPLIPKVRIISAALLIPACFVSLVIPPLVELDLNFRVCEKAIGVAV
jgi:hypothetical protein